MRNIPKSDNTDNNFNWDMYSLSHRKKLIYRELKVLEKKDYPDVVKINNRYRIFEEDTMLLVYFMVFARNAGQSIMKFKFTNAEMAWDDWAYDIGMALFEQHKNGSQVLSDDFEQVSITS